MASDLCLTRLLPLVVALLLLPRASTTTDVDYDDDGSSSTVTTIYVNSSSPSATTNSSCWYGGEMEPCDNLDLGLHGLWNRSHSTDGPTTLIIAPGHYELSASTPTEFNNSGPIAIIGSSVEIGSSVRIDCAFGAGLSFTRVNNITFRGVSFYYCGALRTSTSYNFNSSNPDFLPFRVALYFLYCKDVTMQHVFVQHTSGTGVVLYNTVGMNRIEHSNFTSNTFNKTLSHSAGGGVYVEFSFCEPGAIECLENNELTVDQNYTHGAKYTFFECTFMYNHADITNFTSNAFILPHMMFHSTFGRGGGLSVFFKGNSSENSVTVQECFFRHNHALWGGALFVEFQDWAHFNNYTIIDTHIQNNSLFYNDSLNEGTGGGGARVGFVFFKNLEAYGNNVLFDGCLFDKNNAYWGGGLSLYAARQLNKVDINSFTMVNCKFSRNAGRLGTAIDLALWHSSLSGRHIRPLITSCNFTNNSVIYNVPIANRGLAGIGAVYIDTLPVLFSGTNIFSDNFGSALAILGDRVFVQPGGTMVFLRNSGRKGGGIAFMGQGSLVMGEDSHLVFINNSAQYQGGAIFSYRTGEHDLISSRNCFISYSDIETPPGMWNASFYFEGNTANGRNNSIFASTILPCVWGANYGSGKDTRTLTQEVFCWNNWIYHDNPKCTNEVASAPATYTLREDHYTAMPGKTLQLGIKAFDELNNDITDTTIFLAQITFGNASFRGTGSLNYDYISNNLLDLHGQPNSTVNLQIETIDPIVIQSKITVKLQSCPPGLTRSTGPINNTVCQCPLSGSGASFAGYLVCHEEQFSSDILHHSWMGYITINGKKETVVGRSPYVDTIGNSEYIPLPTNPDNLTQFFCSGLNRHGVLCGSCIPNYGPSVVSSACVYCPDEVVRYNWLLYLLVVFVPITIFFVFIFILSMSTTFGPLNAFIFFAQIITTTAKVDAEGTVFFDSLANNDSTSVLAINAVQNLYTVVYDIWNLNFFLPWIPPFCLSPNINSVSLKCLSYLSALYPLILLILFWITISLYNRGVRPCVMIIRPFHRCLARMRGWLKLQRPIAGGIALFLVISYTKFTFVSFELLVPTSLFNTSGAVVKQVMYWDGDMEFGAPSAVYVTISVVLLVLFGFIPPILLILPSLLHAIGRVCTCAHRVIGKLQPSGKLQQFLEVFHGCYKDGTNGTIDCRWFAGLYFCLRIVLFATFTASLTWMYQYTLQLIIFLFSAFLFAVMRPYKQDWINNVDTTIFLLMTAVTVLSLYNLSLVRAGYTLSLWAYALQRILIFVPLVYCVGYLLIHFCYRRAKRFYYHRLASLRRRHLFDIPHTIMSTEVGLHNANQLTDSTGVENFLDFTQATGRLEGQAGMTNSVSWGHRQPRTRRQQARSRLGEDSEQIPFLRKEREGTGRTDPTSINTVSSGRGAANGAN